MLNPQPVADMAVAQLLQTHLVATGQHNRALNVEMDNWSFVDFRAGHLVATYSDTGAEDDEPDELTYQLAGANEKHVGTSGLGACTAVALIANDCALVGHFMPGHFAPRADLAPPDNFNTGFRDFLHAHAGRFPAGTTKAIIFHVNTEATTGREVTLRGPAQGGTDAGGDLLRLRSMLGPGLLGLPNTSVRWFKYSSPAHLDLPGAPPLVRGEGTLLVDGRNSPAIPLPEVYLAGVGAVRLDPVQYEPIPDWVGR